MTDSLAGDLEFQVNAIFDVLKIGQENKEAVWAFLAPLKHKNPTTKIHYHHSFRVGLLARKIAAFMHLDQKALFYAGLMHDLGKCQVALDTLGKTEGWTERDTQEMEGHVLDSYDMVRGRFDFSAEVITWHHKFQKNGYPKVVPPALHGYSEGTKLLIPEYGRILALADVYDALHRVNDKFGEKRALSDDEIMEKMLELNLDRKALVVDLYNADVFIRKMEEEVEPGLYNQGWRHISTNLRIPTETARQIMIATALEPVSDKEGCTSRDRNISRHLKLEYFIVGGINLGHAFESLAERILFFPRFAGMCTNQELIYDIALRAQRESVRNRGGGRINQGIIELLMSIVTAQYMHDMSQRYSVSDILHFAGTVMKNTSREDVNQLIEMKKLANQLSHYSDRQVAQHLSAKNIFEYYQLEFKQSSNSTSLAHNNEFVAGFQTVQLAYDVMIGADIQGFENKIELAYQAVLEKHDRSVGRGFLADCIAVALYLVLSQNPRIKFIV